MNEIENLIDKNRHWSERVKSEDPEFFAKLASQQNPEYLWIGCSDSRVPANQIVDLMPGEIFVHRNVANLVVHTDFNCLTVLQYAVDVLKVKHVMVVGHYGCGGVTAAYENADNGMIDNWLRNIKDVKDKNEDALKAVEGDNARINLLVELSVRDQVAHVCQTTITQNAWGRGQPLSVHGLVYSLEDGLLKDLNCSVDSAVGVSDAYRVLS